MGASRFWTNRRAVVLAAEHPVFLVDAGRDRARRIRALAVARDRTRRSPVPRDHRAVPVGLPRAFDLEFPLSRSTVADDMANRSRTCDAGLHADWDVGVAADHSRLHDFRLLDLRRKAARGRRLSLRRWPQSPPC